MSSSDNRNPGATLATDTPAALELRAKVLRCKRFLHLLYREWYEQLAADVPTGPGRIVELGSGGSFMSDVEPDLIATDIIPHHGVQVALDGCALPFRAASLRGIVMLNVLHHLPDVHRFFEDASRCLRPGGVVSMLEPWVTPWSTWLYRHLHHEPFDPAAPAWQLMPGCPLSCSNNALAWMVFQRDRTAFEAAFPSLRVQNIVLTTPCRYLLAGGVSRPPLMPAWSFGFWKRVESLLTPFLPQFAMFARVVLRKTGTPP